MKNILSVCNSLILCCAACEVRAVSAQSTASCVLGCTLVTAVAVAVVCVRAGNRYSALRGQCAVRSAFVNSFAASWVRRVGNLGPLQVRVVDY